MQPALSLKSKFPLNSCRMMLVMLALGGCSYFPASGPTGPQIERSTDATKSTIGAIPIVEVTDFGSLPAPPALPAVFAPDYAPPPTDMIGAGDLLDISIFEAGVTLFGSTGAGSTGRAPAEPTAQVEKLPAIRVDDNGFIRLPYAGTLKAAGRTASQLETAIRRAIAGMSQNPQVLVSIREAINNSVIVGGEIGRPGRLALPTNQETLSDVVALAGGYRGDAKDIAVRVLRQDMNVEFRLSDVMSGPKRDMRIYPGDKISLIRYPRSFSVMGAPGRVEQIPFSGPTVSLAEALATAGGANPNLGDPAAIFVFRFTTAPDQTEQPVVYHLDMMKAGSYFLAQRFVMQDKDILYVGNAVANQPSKAVQIVSQLFAPIVTVRNIVN